MDEDGNAMFACADNLAARARVSIKQAEAAIEAFESPDSKSGDPDNEGRRIERFPGGWRVLNAHKYRALVTRAIIREQTRIRVEKHRSRKAVTQSNADVTQANGSVTPSEALSVSKAKNPSAASLPLPPPEFDHFKAVYPRRSGAQPWKAALRAISARLAEGHSWAELLAGATRYGAWCSATDKVGTEFVKQAAAFCGPEKFFLEPWELPASHQPFVAPEETNA